MSILSQKSGDKYLVSDNSKERQTLEFVYCILFTSIMDNFSVLFPSVKQEVILYTSVGSNFNQFRDIAKNYFAKILKTFSPNIFLIVLASCSKKSLKFHEINSMNSINIPIPNKDNKMINHNTLTLPLARPWTVLS